MPCTGHFNATGKAFLYPCTRHKFYKYRRNRRFLRCPDDFTGLSSCSQEGGLSTDDISTNKALTLFTGHQYFFNIGDYFAGQP